MDRKALPLRLIALLVVTAGFTTGCQTDRLKAERDNLYKQNQDLQTAWAKANADRDAAAAEQARLAAEKERLEAELAARHAAPPAAPLYSPVTTPIPPARTPAATGFESIPGIETQRTADRITVRVPGDVLFEPGKIDVKTSAQKTLDQVIAVIRKQYPSNKIRIEGYTDSDPIVKSKWKDNLELSQARAAAVHRYLGTKGMPEKQMYTAGFGPANPRATKAQSRRVEIVVILNEKLASK
jgi:type VI secretion system protein ImpK